jgi:hypothetical protein
MASDGFGEAQPMGGEARPSGPAAHDPFTSPAPPSAATPGQQAPQTPPQPPAIYHPPPAPGSVSAYDVPPMPPPSFTPGASTERNWMGIVSLVFGILGGGLIGLGLGIAGLRAAQAGRATNRTVAIWGIVLNCTMWIVYFIGFGALGALSAAFSPTGTGDAPSARDVFGDGLPANQVPVTEIPFGACFMDPELQDDGYYYGVEVVSCDEPHDSQVYAVGDLAQQAYISEEAMGDIAWDICFTDESTAAVHPAVAADLYADVYFPSLESWNQGDRGYVCFLWDERGPLTNSVLAADLEVTEAD